MGYEDAFSELIPSTVSHPLYEEVVAACRTVFDPDIHINVFDMGLIYTINIQDDRSVTILMSLTSPTCHVAGEIPMWVADAVRTVSGLDEVKVFLVWDPPWSIHLMSDETKLELGFL